MNQGRRDFRDFSLLLFCTVFIFAHSSQSSDDEFIIISQAMGQSFVRSTTSAAAVHRPTRRHIVTGPYSRFFVYSTGWSIPLANWSSGRRVVGKDPSNADSGKAIKMPLIYSLYLMRIAMDMSFFYVPLTLIYTPTTLIMTTTTTNNNTSNNELLIGDITSNKIVLFV